MQTLTVVAIMGPVLLTLIQQAAPSPALQIVGVVLTLGGVVLRAVAMRTLGLRFQLTPRSVPTSPELTTGPYCLR